MYGYEKQILWDMITHHVSKLEILQKLPIPATTVKASGGETPFSLNVNVFLFLWPESQSAIHNLHGPYRQS